VGAPESCSTLIPRRPDKKISSAGALSIPASSSLGAVTPRRAALYSAPGRNVASQTAREQRTNADSTPAKQQRDLRSSNSNKATTSGQVSCISNRRKIAASSAQKDSKFPASSSLSLTTITTATTTVSCSRNTVKTVDVFDFCDLEDSPSRAPASTALQPEVFHRTRARRRSRLAGNDDVSNMVSSSSSAAKKKPAKQRSRAADTDVDSVSAVNKCVTKEDVETAEVNSSHVTSVTSTVHRDPDPDCCNVGQVASNVVMKTTTTASNTRTSPSCSNRRQQIEEKPNTYTTNFNGDSFSLQTSGTSIDIGEEKSSSYNAMGFQHSYSGISSVSLAQSVQENSSTSKKERPGYIHEEKPPNYLRNTTNTNNGIFLTESHQRNREAEFLGRQNREMGRVDNKKVLSPFDELEIERDFEFMDEILSSATAEVCRFIRPPHCHFSDGPSTQLSSTRIDTLLGQLEACATASVGDGFSDRRDYTKFDAGAYSSCPTWTTSKSRAAGLLYTVNSVVSAPVVEIAKSMSQEHCLSSPRLSDYVPEDRHKVEEVSAEQHYHHHHQYLAGPGRRQEDLGDGSPSSDEIVLGSSDTSTKCSLSSPSGSQDSCRWRSPDDSTLVGDPESCSVCVCISRSVDVAMLH